MAITKRCRDWLWDAFVAVFLPEGYPDSVSSDYAPYQLWDTVQQVTFFVNTVISSQAIMKFHGVGDPTKTAVQATALEQTRCAIAEFVSIAARVPAMTKKYKRDAGHYRLLSEILNAAGHFIEILAAIFSDLVAFLYLGPMICRISGAVSGATRSVLMQHFAIQGNNGEISFKESNQDKGGKICGLIVGTCLLFGYIGVSQASAASELECLYRSVGVFAVLSCVHIWGNFLAVRKLTLPRPEDESPACNGSESHSATMMETLRGMYLPPGYPGSVASSYTKFRLWAVLSSLVAYPKSVVSSLAFWANVYGAGDASKTPMSAVQINIFMMSVQCVVALLAGLPAVKRALSFSSPAWRLRSALIGRLGEAFNLAAALSPPWLFYPVVVVSMILSAFAGVSGSFINADIQRCWSRSSEVALADLAVTTANQEIACRLTTAIGSIAFLYHLDASGATTSASSVSSILFVWSLLQSISVMSDVGTSWHLPPLGNSQDPAKALKQALLQS